MWTDMGRQAYLIYQGAVAEGASEKDAVKIVTAFYAGVFRGSTPLTDDEDSP